MNTTNYSKGSQWHKWDLHVHTPSSIVQDYGGEAEEVWIKFFESLENLPTDIKVLGINDYLFFDGYKKVLKYKQDGGLNNISLILPVIEFRLKEFVGNAKLNRLNYHIIFANEDLLSIEVIEAQFLSGLRGKANLDPEITTSLTWGGVVTKDSLIDLGDAIFKSTPAGKNDTTNKPNLLKLGFNNINFELSKIEELLGERNEPNKYFQNKYFKAIGKAEWEDFRWDGSINDKKTIINNCHFIFTASPSVEVATKSKLSLIEQNVNSRLLHCSDSHQFPIDKNFTKPKDIGHCFTWIKADTTFEGLKQVLFETEERVKLQVANPDLDFDKAVFRSLTILDDLKILKDKKSNLSFSGTKIDLNQNLISIIGGRGKGKSMLINYLGYGFLKDINKKLAEKFLLSKDFSVDWKQSLYSEIKTFTLDIQRDLPFTFIHQSKIKEIADDNEALKDEVISMLKGAGFEKYNKSSIGLEVKELYQDYWNIKDWLSKENPEGAFVNDSNEKSESIAKIQGNIDLVTDVSNKLFLEKYVKNLKEINEQQKVRQELKELRKIIIDSRDLINSKIESISNAITPLDTKEQQLSIRNLYKAVLIKIEELKKENITIKDENFKDFRGDLSQLLLNLSHYQTEISDLESDLNNIKEKERELEETKKKIETILKSYESELWMEVINLNSTWQEKIFNNPERNPAQNEIVNKLLLNRNIKIEGDIIFNEVEFLKIVEKYVDGRKINKNDNQKLLEAFGIKNHHDVLKINLKSIEALKSKFKCFYEGAEFDILKVFIDPELRSKYINVYPIISQDNKELSELSAGQKGTIYLCLKLATQLFSGPIIFDQPEDDLDNEFIHNELIDLFKEIKKFRQVIIVSHNANLVVNADSEQIIIAENQDEILSYLSGSLENPVIHKKICDILEGGENAFKKRLEKYRYSNMTY